MKKFVIIALIFALAAGAAFAQDGSWSVSGRGEIGTMLNFNGNKTPKSELQGMEDAVGETLVPASSPYYILSDNAKTTTLIGASGFHNLDYYGFIGADLNVYYTIGGLKTGLGFEAHRGGFPLFGDLEYNDGTFAFQYKQDIIGLFSGAGFNPERLWGYFKFLDGKIHLEAAANSRDTVYLYSRGVYTQYDDTVLYNLFVNQHVNSIQAIGSWRLLTATRGYNGDDIRFGNTYGKINGISGRGFTKVDHNTYLYAQVDPIDGLNIGVFVPGVFAFGKAHGNGVAGTSNSGIPGYVNGQTGNTHINFVDEALLKSVIGAKFASGPVEFAAQLGLTGRQYKWKTTTEKAYELKADGTVDKEYTRTVLVPDVKFETVTGTTFPAAIADPNNPTNTELLANLNYADKFIGTQLYLGGKFKVNDSLGAGLAFEGNFSDSKRPLLGFGVEAGFNAGAFGAGLGIGLLTKINPTEELLYPAKKGDPTTDTVGVANKTFNGIYNVNTSVNDFDKIDGELKKQTATTLGITPSLQYAVVPEYLMVSLDANLFWKLGLHERKFQEDVFGYEITPIIWFNVAGTGAARGWYSGNNTAIMIRYKVAGMIDGSELRAAKKTWTNRDVNASNINQKPIYNGLDISFKWSF